MLPTLAERLRQRRPCEHRGLRRRNVPSCPAEEFHQRVAALAIGVAHLADAVVGAVQRRGGRHLDRRERAVIEIGFDPRQRGDDALVADRKSHAPAGHRERLRHRGEFDGDVDRAGHLQHRGRRVVVEIDFGIGKVGQDEDLVLLRERHEVLVEIEARDMGGRIRRVADDQRDRFWDGMDDRALQAAKKSGVGSDGTERITPPAIRNPKAWIG